MLAACCQWEGAPWRWRYCAFRWFLQLAPKPLVYCLDFAFFPFDMLFTLPLLSWTRPHSPHWAMSPRLTLNGLELPEDKSTHRDNMKHNDEMKDTYDNDTEIHA